MVIPDGEGTVRFTEHELHTAVMLYLREIHNVPIGRVVRVLVPVYDASGNVGATATLKAE